jgi:DNA-binding NarL/FixJ family response regulator
MNAILTTIISTSGASFLNFLGTKTYNAITGKKRNFFWKNKETSLGSLRSNLSFDDLKKRIRIVVIDDEEGFPIKYFQSEGYAIEKWDKVTDVSYGKLECGFYDIIVLDIKGVAQDISSDDGLGVLESIKRKNPAQIIIAYSQHSYDLSKTKFFHLADESIAKPSDFLTIKEKIDNLINSKYNPGRYISTLHTLLQSNNLTDKEIKKIDSQLYKVIEKKEKPNWSKVFDFTKNNGDLIKQSISLANTVLKFFQ